MVRVKTKRCYKCSRCYRTIRQDRICIIDDKSVCVTCLYGKTKPLKIYPIGMVKNELKRAENGFGTSGKEGISRIELFGPPGQVGRRLQKKRSNQNSPQPPHFLI